MSHLTEEQLNLYLDNELSTSECAAVEAHLVGCDVCRAELASLQALFTALDALQPDALAADLTPVVLHAVAAERRRAVWRQRISWLVPTLQRGRPLGCDCRPLADVVGRGRCWRVGSACRPWSGHKPLAPTPRPGAHRPPGNRRCPRRYPDVASR